MRNDFRNENNVSKFIYTTMSEYLNESILDKKFRSINLLYHSTSFSNLMDILTDNILYGTSSYDYGIATSRNKNYLFLQDNDSGPKRGEGESQLILNRDKIKSNYKIQAFDWEEYKSRSDSNYHQSEDKILTNKIVNIKEYIVGIHLNKNTKHNFKLLLEKEFDFLTNNNITIFDKNWEVLNF